MVYDARSLYLFHHKSKLRRFIVGMTESKFFETIILTTILMNCVQLALYDYKDSHDCHLKNRLLSMAGNVFSVCFIVECACKIISQGFIMHRNSYLSDRWNWLDFIVVLGSMLEALSIFRGRALRLFRVLRPLRSVKAWPAMQKLIQTLVESLPSLNYVLLFML